MAKLKARNDFIKLSSDSDFIPLSATYDDSAENARIAEQTRQEEERKRQEEANSLTGRLKSAAGSMVDAVKGGILTDTAENLTPIGYAGTLGKDLVKSAVNSAFPEQGDTDTAKYGMARREQDRLTGEDVYQESLRKNEESTAVAPQSTNFTYVAGKKGVSPEEKRMQDIAARDIAESALGINSEFNLGHDIPSVDNPLLSPEQRAAAVERIKMMGGEVNKYGKLIADKNKAIADSVKADNFDPTSRLTMLQGSGLGFASGAEGFASAVLRDAGMKGAADRLEEKARELKVQSGVMTSGSRKGTDFIKAANTGDVSGMLGAALDLAAVNGLSTAGSVAAIVNPVARAVWLPVMSATEGGSDYVEGKDLGLSDDEALAKAGYGAVSAYVFERLGVDAGTAVMNKYAKEALKDQLSLLQKAGWTAAVGAATTGQESAEEVGTNASKLAGDMILAKYADVGQDFKNMVHQRNLMAESQTIALETALSMAPMSGVSMGASNLQNNQLIKSREQVKRTLTRNFAMPDGSVVPLISALDNKQFESLANTARQINEINPGEIDLREIDNEVIRRKVESATKPKADIATHVVNVPVVDVTADKSVTDIAKQVSTTNAPVIDNEQPATPSGEIGQPGQTVNPSAPSPVAQQSTPTVETRNGKIVVRGFSKEQIQSVRDNLGIKGVVIGNGNAVFPEGTSAITVKKAFGLNDWLPDGIVNPDDVILQKGDKPFSNRQMALLHRDSKGMKKTHAAAKVDGGYALVPKVASEAVTPSVEIQSETKADPIAAYRKVNKKKSAPQELLSLIRHLGGINSRYAMDLTGEPNGNKVAPYLFSDKGRSLDDLATMLATERGFTNINHNDQVDGGVQDLRDLIQLAISGTKQYAPEVQAEMDNDARLKEYQNNVKDKAKALGIKTHFRSFADIEKDVQAAVAKATTQELGAADTWSQADQEVADVFAEIVDYTNWQQTLMEMASDDATIANVAKSVQDEISEFERAWGEYETQSETAGSTGQATDQGSQRQGVTNDEANNGGSPDQATQQGQAKQTDGKESLLTTYTNADILERDQQAQENEAEVKRIAAALKAEQAAKDKAEVDAKTKARVENPDNFQFGESSKDAVKPVGDLFALGGDNLKRGEIGASLTKEQRKSVLKTLTDVYKKNGAPREFKGIDSNGNERYGYAYSPEYFATSDITGAKIRYFVELPDGKIAHPTELFSDYTQADIDAALQKEVDLERSKSQHVDWLNEQINRIASSGLQSVRKLRSDQARLSGRTGNELVEYYSEKEGKWFAVEDEQVAESYSEVLKDRGYKRVSAYTNTAEQNSNPVWLPKEYADGSKYGNFEQTPQQSEQVKADYKPLSYSEAESIIDNALVETYGEEGLNYKLLDTWKDNVENSIELARFSIPAGKAFGFEVKFTPSSGGSMYFNFTKGGERFDVRVADHASGVNFDSDKDLWYDDKTMPEFWVKQELIPKMENAASNADGVNSEANLGSVANSDRSDAELKRRKETVPQDSTQSKGKVNDGLNKVSHKFWKGETFKEIAPKVVASRDVYTKKESKFTGGTLGVDPTEFDYYLTDGRISQKISKDVFDYIETLKAKRQSISPVKDEVTKAKEALSAAGVTGKDYTDTVAQVRQGNLTADEVAEAHGADKQKSGNTFVTDEKYEEAKAKLAKNLSPHRLNSNPFFDPENAQLVAIIGAYHIEHGARTLAKFTKAMKQEAGKNWDLLKERIEAVFAEAMRNWELSHSKLEPRIQTTKSITHSKELLESRLNDWIQLDGEIDGRKVDFWKDIAPLIAEAADEIGIKKVYIDAANQRIVTQMPQWLIDRNFNDPGQVLWNTPGGFEQRIYAKLEGKKWVRENWSRDPLEAGRYEKDSRLPRIEWNGDTPEFFSNNTVNLQQGVKPWWSVYDIKGKVVNPEASSPIQPNTYKTGGYAFNAQSRGKNARLFVLRNMELGDLNALKSGVMNNPSIAVTDKPITGFGEITFVGDRGIVQPKEKGHYLFSGDAWTIMSRANAADVVQPEPQFIGNQGEELNLLDSVREDGQDLIKNTDNLGKYWFKAEPHYFGSTAIAPYLTKEQNAAIEAYSNELNRGIDSDKTELKKLKKAAKDIGVNVDNLESRMLEHKIIGDVSINDFPFALVPKQIVQHAEKMLRDAGYTGGVVAYDAASDNRLQMLQELDATGMIEGVGASDAENKQAKLSEINAEIDRLSSKKMSSSERNRYYDLLDEKATLQTKETDKGVALFSRQSGIGSPSHKAAVEYVAKPLLEGLANTPGLVVVQSSAELPFDAPTDAKGSLWHGDIYLVADNLTSPVDVRDTVAHELMGHFGLRGFFGADLDVALDEIHRANPRVRVMAEKWRINNQRLISDWKHKYGMTDAQVKYRSIEEAMSEIAQTGEKISGLKRLVAVVQKMLRAIGFNKWADALEVRTDAESLTMLKKAEMFVKRGWTESDSPIPDAAYPLFMTAYHGSPHDHNKFDSQYIGTGEGAQAYGWGHYFAGAKSVAEYYRNALSQRQPAVRVNSEITRPDRGTIADRALIFASSVTGPMAKRPFEGAKEKVESLANLIGNDAEKIIKQLDEWIDQGAELTTSGRLYTVDLKPSDDEYLLWDAPKWEQSQKVQDAFLKYGGRIDAPEAIGSKVWTTGGWGRGENLYRKLTDELGSQQAASEYLRSLGIRGIKYLDGSSRGKGDGNYNYVIFDDADVEITHKESRGATSNTGFTPTNLAQSLRNAFGGIVDRLLARGEKGLRGGVVIAADMEEATKLFAEKSGRTLEQAKAQLKNSVSDEIKQELIELSDLAKADGNENKVVEIGGVDSWESESAKSAGIDISGFTHSADMYSVRHVYKNHGNAEKEQSRGQIAISEKDIVEVPNVVLHPDSIILGLKNHRGQDLVFSVKAMQDGTLLVVEEVRTGRKTLALESIRKIPGAKNAKELLPSVLLNVRSDAGISPIVIDAPSNVKQVEIKLSENGVIQGFYDPKSGLTYLIADHLNDTTGPAVLAHEVLHGTDSVAIQDQAISLIESRSNPLTAKRVREFLNTVHSRMESAGVEGDKTEAANYIVEQALTVGRQHGFSTIDDTLFGKLTDLLGKKVSDFVKNFIAKVRANLFKRGVYVKLSVDDYIALAKSGMKQAAEGNVNADGDVVSRSKSNNKEQQSAAVNNEVPKETAVEKAQRIGQDQFNRFKTLGAWLKNQGINLSDAADVYLNETLMSGRISTRKEDFREKVMGPLIKKTQEAGFTMEQIAEYLKAQHAPEANKRMRELHDDENATAYGVSDDDAKAIIDELKKLPDFDKLKSIANEWRGITDKTRDILYTSGIISKDMYDAWNAAYSFYVPVKGDALEVRTDEDRRVNFRKQRLGHALRNEAIIENILRDHESAIAQDERNKLGKSLIRFAMEIDNPDIITVGKPVKRNILKKGETKYIVTYHGSDIAVFDTAADARFYAQEQSSKPGRNGADFVVVESKDPVRVMQQASPLLGENEVNVYVGGNAIRVQINDEIAARAYKRLGVENLNAVLSAGRDVNNWLSKAYTGYSPDFILTNPIRDAIQGAMTLTGAHGAGTAARVYANYPLAVKELIKHFRNPGSSQIVSDYRNSGGSTGGAYLSDLERIGNDMQAAYNEYQGVLQTYKSTFEKAKSEGKSDTAAHTLASIKSGAAGFREIPVIGHFLKLMEKINAITENALRVATYHTLVQHGMSKQRAAAQAKNLMNFNRKGEIANQMGAMYLFFNPNVQGSNVIYEALMNSEHKGQARALTGMMVLSAIALSALNAGGDDEDKNKWDNTPDYIKDGNLVLGFGKHQFMLPLPYGYRVFHALGNVMYDAAQGKDKTKLGIRLANSVFENFSPMGNPMAGENGAFQILPTSVKMALGPGVNEDSMGKEISPKRWSDAKPDSQLMHRNTKGTLYSGVAEKLNSMTGGSKYEKGMIDVSPETLKYWVQSLTGGAGRFAMDAINIPMTGAQGVIPDNPREYPIARRFVREAGVSDKRNAFWERANEAKEAADAFSEARKAHDGKAIKEMMKEKGPLIQLSKVSNSLQKVIKAKRDAIDNIRNDDKLTLSEKNVKMKEIELEEAKVYDRFINQFDTKMEKMAVNQ